MSQIASPAFLTHIDEQTGREVRRFPLLNALDGRSYYFRQPRRIGPSHVLCMTRYRGAKTRVALLEPETGEVRTVMLPGDYLNLREADGLFWCTDYRCRVWQIALPDGSPELLAALPEELPGEIVHLTCDARHVILAEYHSDPAHRPPNSNDPAELFAFFNRPRHGALHAYDLHTGGLTTLVELDGMLPIHPDASPTDPGLVKFSHDNYDAHCQRIWTVRVDGTGLTAIRPQEWNELITHEFWWPDGQCIGFKYQDRRHDPTVMSLPWAEYAPSPTRFGLAALDGTQAYLSDPLESYHSHIFVSGDGTLLTGEGTHDHSCVYVARFRRDTPWVDFIPHATIHTPCLPLAGQKVNAGMTADNRWVVYNDTIDGVSQVCAVRVEVD